MSTKIKRKNYLINKRFQLKYTISIVVLLAAVMMISSLGIYFGMWGSIIENFSQFRVSQNLETAKRISDYESVRYRKGDYRIEKIFREAELLSAEQRGALRNALKAVNRSLFPKVILLAALLFLAGIFISHKIAGPMYRIERSAEAIRGGDLSVNFRIRKGDEMKAASSALERMVDSLQADFAKIKMANKAINGKVTSIEKQISKEDVTHLKELLRAVEEVLSKYKT